MMRRPLSGGRRIVFALSVDCESQECVRRNVRLMCQAHRRNKTLEGTPGLDHQEQNRADDQGRQDNQILFLGNIERNKIESQQSHARVDEHRYSAY